MPRHGATATTPSGPMPGPIVRERGRPRSVAPIGPCGAPAVQVVASRLRRAAESVYNRCAAAGERAPWAVAGVPRP